MVQDGASMRFDSVLKRSTPSNEYPLEGYYF